MKTEKEKCNNLKADQLDGLCVSLNEGFDSALSVALCRRTRYESDEENVVTVRRYNVDGQVFTVRSFFGKDEKRIPADIIRRLIDQGGICKNEQKQL